MAWLRYRRSRSAVWSLRVLYVLIFFAVFGDFLANEKPLYCKIDGEHYFPVIRQYGVGLGWVEQKDIFFQKGWREHDYERVVFPPVPYSSTTTDVRNRTKGPFSDQRVESLRYRHWLGTDRLGHDLVAGMIAGTRVALLVGLIAMSVAAFIGIVLGSLAGFFGDDRFRVSRARLWINLPACFLAWFYGFKVRSFELAGAMQSGKAGWEIGKSLLIVLFIFFIANLFVPVLKKIPWLRKKWTVPLDLLVMRAIEVVNSIPGLLLLLSLVAVLQKSSIFWIMAIIGLIRWTSIARFLRAELLRIRNLNYIEAGRALGFSEGRILLRHALPNALTPVLITIAFGVASAVLLESALSFLGIGVGEDGITWGRLLSEARNHPSAWWLAVFPGGAIFITVTIFNLIGEGLNRATGGK